VVPAGAPSPSIKRKLDVDEKLEENTYVLEDGTQMIKNTEKFNVDFQVINAIEKIINGLAPAFAKITVKNITKSSITPKENAKTSKVSFWVRVSGFGSRFCLNKGSEHSSSTIYFVITQNGISQKCFCKKNDQRHSGSCSKFTSPCTTITESLILRSLFDIKPIQPCDDTDLMLKLIKNKKTPSSINWNLPLL
jgi:hypothetical protein